MGCTFAAAATYDRANNSLVLFGGHAMPDVCGGWPLSGRARCTERLPNSLTRSIHEPAACKRDLSADRGVANPGRFSECYQHACVAAGARALRSADISHFRLAVRE